jgi:hypothetical protein
MLTTSAETTSTSWFVHPVQHVEEEERELLLWGWILE